MVTKAMLKALEAYKGPIAKCPPGQAYDGARDLEAWARRRSVGLFGVEDWDRHQARKRRAKRRVRRYHQYKASKYQYFMTYKQWLKKRKYLVNT